MWNDLCFHLLKTYNFPSLSMQCQIIHHNHDQDHRYSCPSWHFLSIFSAFSRQHSYTNRHTYSTHMQTHTHVHSQKIDCHTCAHRKKKCQYFLHDSRYCMCVSKHFAVVAHSCKSVFMHMTEIKLWHIWDNVCVCMVCWWWKDVNKRPPSLSIQSSPVAFSHLNTLYWQLPPCN